MRAAIPDLYERLPSPAGELLLLSNDSGLAGVYFQTRRHGPGALEEALPAAGQCSAAAEILADARAQLGEYFAGTRRAFAIPLAARGTPFQQRVWHALQAIGYGEVISYTELARRVDAPRGVRAVGGANARNPLSIVVPCHRVVGADGSLTGFGGGIERKRWLLRHEAAYGVAPSAE